MKNEEIKEMTPLEALKYLQVLFPQATLICQDSDGVWSLCSSKTDFYLDLYGIKIKYTGGWQDSMFTTTEGG